MLRPVKPGNSKRTPSGHSRAGSKRHGMRPRIIGALLLAVLGVGLIFQAPSALADDSGNPFLALWDAIFSLQSKDEDLQDQIDELRAGQRAQLAQAPELVSDLYTEIQVEATEDWHTLVYVKAGNAGQDRADEVKLTAFYLMPLFEINSIDNNSCEAESRGIIECSLGILESGQETMITIDATARESDEENTWTVDISSSTEDSDFSNNHVTYDFETGSGEQVQVQDDESVDVETIDPEHGSELAFETETPQVISDDPATNETSSENSASEEPEESSSNMAEDSESANDAQEESTEPAQVEEQTQDQSTSEESGADQSPEQDTNSESTGNEDTEQTAQEPSEQNESSEQSASASEETQSP